MLQNSSIKSSQLYFARCGGAHPSISTQKAKAGCDWEATLSTQQVPGQLELYSETLSYPQTRWEAGSDGAEGNGGSKSYPGLCEATVKVPHILREPSQPSHEAGTITISILQPEARRLLLWLNPEQAVGKQVHFQHLRKSHPDILTREMHKLS